MSIFICKMCGHIAFNEAPDNCPMCGAPKNSFEQNDNIFTESEEKSPEASVKHVPAITVKKECGLIPENSCVDVIVRIGSTLHPMEEKHFIKFIDCYVDNKPIERIALLPGVNPAGCIHLKVEGKKIQIVENCTIHGYWMADASIE